MPVIEDLDVQLALRHENFSDVGSTTVGKVAFGWRPMDEILLRGSWSEAFRAPNLITINEDLVARSNSRRDWLCTYAAEYGGDPDEDIVDCYNSIQRTAQGSQALQPETSTNTSVGLVVEPIDNLTITVDFWKIEKDNTIGLFGEENHTLLDLVQRLQQGNGNCAAISGNSAIVRDTEIDTEVADVYTAAGLCPAGDILRIDDQYANLDTRILEGHDIGVYYNLDTDFGTFDFNYNIAMLDKFEQKSGGLSAELVDAQESGLLPVNYPVDGFADLLGRDGNQEKREKLRLSWRYGDFTTALTGYRIGEFYQSSLTLADGTRYVIPSMTRLNLSLTYRTEGGRIRVGMNNLQDERAPLADRYFGYFADAHTDYGRSVYVDFKMYLGE